LPPAASLLVLDDVDGSNVRDRIRHYVGGGQRRPLAKSRARASLWLFDQRQIGQSGPPP